MRIGWLGIAAVALFCLGVAAYGQDPLAAGFRNPPASAKPHTWWHWVNGNVTKEGISADLQAMKRAGIGGAQIFNVDVGIPAGGAPFMGDRWQELIRHATAEAHRLGIELCVHNGAGWSSSGGPWIKPDQGMQTLVWTERAVHGPAHFDDALFQPQARLNTYHDIAVLAFRKPEEETDNHKLRISNIREKACFSRGGRIAPDYSPTPRGMAVPRDSITDLTDRLQSGRLTWDVPEGDWVLLRIGYTPTGEVNHPAPPSGLGLECDKLSKEALDAHWSGMMAAVLRDAGPLAGKTLNNALIDSYEVGSQNWTPRFREEFRQRRGYDPLPFLPVVTGRVVQSIVVSERFLWDFRRTIADMFADNYYGHFAELCREHGLFSSAEPYGNGPFDNMQCGGRVDIPMAEFWVGGGAMETTKMVSSVGHTYGRHVIGAESFTADVSHGRWMVDPYAIKALGDQVFCNGVNRYIFHRWAAQPWLDKKPGMTMGPWGTMFERTETWWDDVPAYLTYVARCQYLLQSGHFTADLLYFEGDDGPNDLPDRNGLRPAPPLGYDYDGCDATVLRERLKVSGGRLSLPDGTAYRVLVLPDSPFMTVETLRKIRDLVNVGATVVGPKPSLSPSLTEFPASDEELTRIANDVWGDVDGVMVTDHAYGAGHVYWGRPLASILADIGVPPDFEQVGGARDARLAYIHRVVSGLSTINHQPSTNLYFVSNQRYQPIRVDCAFRVSGTTPELWHPDTGAMEPAPVYHESGGRTMVSLQLDPAGSVFVVFRRPSTGEHLVSVTPPPLNTEGANLSAGPKIEIRSARYEAADGSGAGADVTGKVRQMVADGTYSIPASNDTFGDPVPNVVKRLRVTYTVDGKPREQTVGENETLELAQASEQAVPASFELITSDGRPVLLPWQGGEYAITGSNDGSHQLTAEAPKQQEIRGAWTVRFPPHLGAPPEVTMDRLVSWTGREEPGVRYFSGTAEYVKEFDAPADMVTAGREVVLDLGRVKNLARVRLNGRDLGVLWKPPFREDVTGLLHPGSNRLEVWVTNLWPNRLIGDEQYPPDVEYRADGGIKEWPQWLLEHKPRPSPERVTFATWRFFAKDSPLLESGLIGPVVLRSARRIPIP